jgi:HAD superfamily hydrolase (TIGR01549 family)
MRLRAALFDFGDTLLSTRMNWERIVPLCLSSLSRALRQDLGRQDLERLGRDFLFLRAAGKRQAELRHVETPATESLAAALELQGVRNPPTELLQRGVDAFFAPEESQYSIVTGIPETLQKLQQLGLRLAVVSNATCGHLVRRALERRHLLGLFDTVVVSAETRRRKPAPEIFARALADLGVEGGEAVMIGDLPDKDIAGANLARIRSVLVDFFGEDKEASGGPPLPDVVVRHPEALVGVFRSWM